jgi:hypothetical protein
MNCKCGNAARYINARGELCCATCPLKEPIDSVKLASVPALLAVARELVFWIGEHVEGRTDAASELRSHAQALREIIGKDASRTY